LEFLYQKGVGYINIDQWLDAQQALQIVFETDPNYKDVQTHLREVNAKIDELGLTAVNPIEVTFTPTAHNSSEAYDIDPTEYRFGGLQAAYIFHDKGHYIDLGNDIISNNIFSFSVWFRIYSDKYAQTVIGNYVACSYSNSGFYLIYYGTEVENGPRLQLSNGGRDESIVINQNMADDQWHHFVGIYGLDTFSAYLDNQFMGEQMGSYAPTQESLIVGTAMVSPDHPNCAYGNDSYFNGSIANIQLYNRMLSTVEIEKLYKKE